MFNKNFVLCIALLLLAVMGKAQNCNLSVRGFVFDEATKLPLSFVNVFVQENTDATLTDDKGNFVLDSICAGSHHFIFSHIGCEAIKIHLDLSRDTILNIALPHTATSLATVVVEGKKNNFNYQANSAINRQAIEDNSHQNLSNLLENETGVHLIKNGTAISKPVVHGLYGNRLTILNNGIMQSGQQWGNDHSPEIDPYSADKITVLKGVNAIEYGGGNMGSAILVEPKPIKKEPHLHGQMNYAYESNGRGNTLNARLEKYSPQLAWRINGTLKKYGDRKTATYWLNNTGIEEANFAVQLEKAWKDKLFLDLYASTFNTQLGILRGSHIGNLTDLEQALTKDIPYFTEPNFSYNIDAPKQQVSHQLVKIRARYFLPQKQTLELVLAGQLNNRKEFDVRRSGRTDIPALSLYQYTLNAELKYAKDFYGNWIFKVGNQNIFTNNTNNPETGILPLIPDYIAWKNGVFSTLSKSYGKAHFNIGIRYDFEYQNVAAISNSVPRVIIRYNNLFHNISGLVGIDYDINKAQSISLNSGYTSRNPAINELYSNGLHQGVSGIEEGDINLKTENALKNTLEYKWLPSPNFSLNALLYQQYFKNYIYLNPQDEIRLTIRGAFPLFKYEQTDANIYGLDVSAQFTIGGSLFGLVKYSYLKGNDIKNDIPLVFMPPNRIFGSLMYRIKKPIKFSSAIIMEGLELEANNRLIFEQKNTLPQQDFAPPPPTYNLLGLKISADIMFANYKFRLFTKFDNLFNVKYRDYLNRQRYFADDIGLSVILGVGLKF
jgi:iron complex outermembrane receptor protein